MVAGVEERDALAAVVGQRDAAGDGGQVLAVADLDLERHAAARLDDLLVARVGLHRQTGEDRLALGVLDARLLVDRQVGALVRQGQVLLDALLGSKPFAGDAVLDEDHLRTQAGDRVHVVADEQNRAALPHDVAHLPKALALERRVADREHLVDDQDLRLQVGRDRERQPDVHAAAVALDRRVEELLDLAERDDLVELALDLGAAHPEDRAVEEDVLAAGQLGVEAGADLQQRRDPPAEHRPALARLGDAAEDFQQRALAGAVAPDEADHLAAVHLERGVLQRPERLGALAGVAGAGLELPHHAPAEPRQRVAERRVLVELLPQEVRLAEAVDVDDRSSHGSSEVRVQSSGR
ncbi:MAG: hypothetical protein AVDCRST_MAG64-1988 [uncultured Phycisphaerae bacterium]|uniref:Uncharacterized protein n=1 Tax=uncultured Phycisphaerae bacterium TaxID=904963 RepID=A0A6J4PC86_9BACT|nr:MAG: hypothetical protein AVDCRST_MAG64-1988 [uncultured Phycisphaerae bacterium]